MSCPSTVRPPWPATDTGHVTTCHVLSAENTPRRSCAGGRQLSHEATSVKLGIPAAGQGSRPGAAVRPQATSHDRVENGANDVVDDARSAASKRIMRCGRKVVRLSCPCLPRKRHDLQCICRSGHWCLDASRRTLC